MNWVRELLLDSLIGISWFLALICIGLAIGLVTFGVGIVVVSYVYHALKLVNECLAKIISILVGVFLGGFTMLALIGVLRKVFT